MVNYKHYDGRNYPIKAWIKGVHDFENPLEPEAFNQLLELSTLPFIHKHIAVMPDCHAGKGSTVGTVIATHKALIPAAVGVDIGCGMVYVRTSIKAEQLPDNLSQIRSDIEASVPHGRTDNGGLNDRGAWGEVPNWIVQQCNFLLGNFPFTNGNYQRLSSWQTRFVRQAGTLGSGNHFIELTIDESGFIGIMLHSGSRGVGNAIGTYFIEKAQKDMQRWFINLPNQDLAYIPEGAEYFDDYINALKWAQGFARVNREIMLQSVKNVLTQYFPDISYDERAINCHHNYVNKEHHFGKNVWVTRKGAVRARVDDLGIIPGSMGTRSFIVRGLGNPDSFHSCSHGAGRIMSRTKAKKLISLSEHIESVVGVECRIDEDVIDESPKAYKDIDKVMAAQSDLVEIVHTLKQVLCVKG